MSVVQGRTAEGKPLFGVIDTTKYRDFSDRSSFPWLLEIHISLEHMTENGLPAENELETVNSFEEQIVSGLSRLTTVHNIGHITGDGLREVYCYLPEPEVAHAFLSELTQHKQVREFEYRIVEDRKWDLAAEWGL